MDNKNKIEQVNNILSIVKLCFLLFAGLIIYKEQIQYTVGKALSTMIILTASIGCIVLLSTYFLWTIWENKSAKMIQKQWVQIGENLAFVLLFTVVIYVSGAAQSEYKFLFLLIIISSTIQMGIRIGMLIAATSSIVVVTIDLITYSFTDINPYFENDLVLIGIFILIAWALGYFVKLDEQYIEQLEYGVNIDNLTDIYNHRYFSHMLRIKTEQAIAKNKPLSLIFLDIDYFKNYNDLNGHQKGDIVLKTIADILKESTRGEDIVARYGGEEFAIILPDTEEQYAVMIGERIRQKIEETHFENQELQPNENLTISLGISSFPEKSKSGDELFKNADDALYRAKFFNKNRVETYTSIFDDLKSSVEEKDTELITSIKTLIMVINVKDRYTYGHTERVVIYCQMIADELELEESERKKLIYAAYLHDIGKIDTPKIVLNKETPLTKEEWETLKQHPVKGAEIIRPVKSINNIIPLIKYHHERYDGAGYPDGLKGEEIPYLARVLTVVDCFDAMTTNRPYKKKRSFDDAIAELQRCKNTQFDPVIVEAFIKALSKRK